MKRFLVGISIVLAATFLSVSASAYNNPSEFNLVPRVNVTDCTQKVEKLDDAYAALTVTYAQSFDTTFGTATFYCTFRVRTEYDSYATNYIDVKCRYRSLSELDENGIPIDYPDDDMGNTQRLYYLSGQGGIGRFYKLYSSFDDGQVFDEGVAHRGCNVKGRWEP